MKYLIPLLLLAKEEKIVNYPKEKLQQVIKKVRSSGTSRIKENLRVVESILYALQETNKTNYGTLLLKSLKIASDIYSKTDFNTIYNKYKAEINNTAHNIIFIESLHATTSTGMNALYIQEITDRILQELPEGK